MIKYCLVFLAWFFSLFCGEDEIVQRLYSHLLIRDYHSAINECKQALSFYPESKNLKKIYIQALAKCGKDDEAMRCWKGLGLSDPLQDSHLLETVAWGIVTHFTRSSQLVVNMASLISAYRTDDVRAVAVLFDYLHSTNASIRAIAAQFSPRYRDITLIDRLKQLLKEEKNWFVRLKVIEALGIMDVKDVKESLIEIVCHPRSIMEEKAAAITSLMTICEEIHDRELFALIESDRSELRYLACQIVAHLNLSTYSDAIAKLLDDPCADVRVVALNTLYFLGLKHLNLIYLRKIINLSFDSSPSVALTAAWITSRFSPEIALQVIKKHIHSSDGRVCRLAAFVLGKIGEVGCALTKEVMSLASDPYVKVNLSLGMMGQGRNVMYVMHELSTFLYHKEENVMWDRSDNPLFTILAPSLVCHLPQIPQYPTMIDHCVHLEILGKLVILRYPGSEQAIKNFLTHHVLGITYMASVMLLEEGGEGVIDVLRNLMKDPDQNVRIQAALALAFAGEGDEAVCVLQEAYHTMDRNLKVHILEALGYIGNERSVSFLIDLLEEPHQVLKVMAASALIQCVYH